MKIITITFALALSFVSTLAIADDMSCGGKVVWVMADHPRCTGNIAFKTDKSGGKGGKWMCTNSKEAGSIALAALTTKLDVYVAIDNAGASSCQQLPHYRNISYIIIG